MINMSGLAYTDVRSSTLQTDNVRAKLTGSRSGRCCSTAWFPVSWRPNLRRANERTSVETSPNSRRATGVFVTVMDNPPVRTVTSWSPRSWMFLAWCRGCGWQWQASLCWLWWWLWLYHLNTADMNVLTELPTDGRLHATVQSSSKLLDNVRSYHPPTVS